MVILHGLQDVRLEVSRQGAHREGPLLLHHLVDGKFDFAVESIQLGLVLGIFLFTGAITRVKGLGESVLAVNVINRLLRAAS